MYKNNKGFSLVEISMVLIIIGVIVAMSVKAYNIVNVAKLRGELSKVSKITDAINTYYNVFGVLPGDAHLSPTGIIYEQTADVTRNLVRADLLDPTDMLFLKHRLLANEIGGIWRFMRCVEMANGTYLRVNNNIIGSSTHPIAGNVCITMDNRTDSGLNYSAIYEYAPIVAQMPWNVVAGFELYNDDANLTGHFGRGTTPYPTSRKNLMGMVNNESTYSAGEYYIKVW